MPTRGSFAKPLLENLTAACLKKYDNCYIPDSENFFSIKKNNIKLINKVEDLIKFPYIVNFNTPSLLEIREKGAMTIDAFKHYPDSDIFVVGNLNAMKFASRMALWFLENNLDSKFIAVPCCPFNSVPFAAFSAGFGSALKSCADSADSFIECANSPMHNPSAGVMEINGDKTGWLAAGTAALSRFSDQILFVAPDGLLDSNKLLMELRKIIDKNKNVLVVVGDSVKISSEKGVVHRKHKVGRVICDIISKTDISIFQFQIAPGVLSLPVHISKQDAKLSKFYASAAVKSAKKCNGNIMVVNRMNYNGRFRFSFETVQLYDAVNTPRKLPEKFIAKNYRATAQLKKHLEFIADI